MFRFAEPTDNRPAKLAPNLKSVGLFWKEWGKGIAGNKPAKLFDEKERGSDSNYSRRKPIYLLLERTINVGKKNQSEAFRLIEEHFSGVPMTKVTAAIREREFNGTLHRSLADPLHPLQLQRPRKRRRKNNQLATSIQL